jgi:hypothetical protein
MKLEETCNMIAQIRLHRKDLWTSMCVQLSPKLDIHIH